jgi:signal transduction histidine kinase
VALARKAWHLLWCESTDEKTLEYADSSRCFEGPGRALEKRQWPTSLQAGWTNIGQPRLDVGHGLAADPARGKLNMSHAPTLNSKPLRLLVIDDNAAIHSDFRKILGAEADVLGQLEDVEKALFGGGAPEIERACFRIDSAYQGQEAVALAQEAVKENDPYALAFVDVRMPPGWDGVETLERMWQCLPDLQAVLCTAYSDYSWEDIVGRLAARDSLLILKKPFDTVEVLQMAHALTRKWLLARQAKLRMEDLDRMVVERTQKLEHEILERERVQDALRRAQKMEAVGCLAAGIAHEFNNLLTVIQGHAGLLRSQGINAYFAAESVERISQASQRAASLTHRLLACSRQQPLRLKLIDLSETVRGMQPALAQLFGEQCKLELECEDYLPQTRADEGNLEQIVMNLALNARDAMPRGGRMRIATRLMEFSESIKQQNLDARAGRFVCLSVSDEGCGMAPEVLNRIFDPFYTTKEVGKGSGLGLSTVHAIVRQHQGWIEVTSQVGQGSSFKIFFPVVDQEAEAKKHAPSAPDLAVACN